jgi:hypothetical protein
LEVRFYATPNEVESEGFMKIPKYWAKSALSARQPGGGGYRLAVWQWSDVSLADAQQKAADKARELARRVQAGETLNRYAYDQRPLREEALRGLTARGQEVGLVTRNKYGAQVLNATQAMFIDIDMKEQELAGSLSGQMGRLLGGQAADPAAPYVARVESWARQHPELGLRVYRTYAGLRVLVTSQVFDPTRVESLEILRALGSDPLYVKLCQAQGCFRARLTPKPWRCGLRVPPSQYPFENAAAEARYRQWEQQYLQSSAPYAVCRLVKTLGPAETHPDLVPVVALHDEATRVPEQRPLA